MKYCLETNSFNICVVYITSLTYLKLILKAQVNKSFRIIALKLLIWLVKILLDGPLHIIVSIFQIRLFCMLVWCLFNILLILFIFLIFSYCFFCGLIYFSAVVIMLLLTQMSTLSCSDLENDVAQRKEGNSLSEGNEVRYSS